MKITEAPSTAAVTGSHIQETPTHTDDKVGEWPIRVLRERTAIVDDATGRELTRYQAIVKKERENGSQAITQTWDSSVLSREAIEHNIEITAQRQKDLNPNLAGDYIVAVTAKRPL